MKKVLAVSLIWLTMFTLWSTYKISANQIVHIRPKCLAAEDSAAHLKLLNYSHTEIDYGCYHKGY